MKLNLNLKKLSSFKLSSIASNITLVLWIFLGLMILLVVWVILGEVRKVTGLSTDTSAAQSQVIRVNREKYNQLENRLNDSAHFSPEPTPKANSFGTPPDKTKTQP